MRRGVGWPMIGFSGGGHWRGRTSIGQYQTSVYITRPSQAVPNSSPDAATAWRRTMWNNSVPQILTGRGLDGCLSRPRMARQPLMARQRLMARQSHCGPRIDLHRPLHRMKSVAGIMRGNAGTQSAAIDMHVEIVPAHTQQSLAPGRHRARCGHAPLSGYRVTRSCSSGTKTPPRARLTQFDRALSVF